MRCWDKKEKAIQLQQKLHLEKIKSEGIGERWKTKKIPRQDQTKQTKTGPSKTTKENFICK